MGILISFPNCQQAVAFCEVLAGPSEFDAECHWPRLRAMDPDEVLDLLKDIADDELTDPAVTMPPLEVRKKIREQMDTAEFRRYLGGQLGMV